MGVGWSQKVLQWIDGDILLVGALHFTYLPLVFMSSDKKYSWYKIGIPWRRSFKCIGMAKWKPGGKKVMPCTGNRFCVRQMSMPGGALSAGFIDPLGLSFVPAPHKFQPVQGHKCIRGGYYQNLPRGFARKVFLW